MSVTRLGVAGLGWLGESLIKDAVRVGSFDVVAVQDVRTDRAAEVAEQYAVERWTGDYAELISYAAVDAVAICTPNALHAGQAQMALRAGKDVLVQKPLAHTFADAAKTVEVAAQTDRILFVDYTYRFLDTMRALRAAIDSPIRSIRAAFHNIYGPGPEKRWFFDPAQSGGGALIDLGVHLIDLGLWLTSPVSVSLDRAELSGDSTVENSARLALRVDHVPFEVAVSWNAPLPVTEIVFEIETARGSVRWENVDGSFFRFRTVRDGFVLLDRETTLREDTLRAFANVCESRRVPAIDTRVYAVLDRAYQRQPPLA